MKVSGFSAVEMLVTLAILAIVLAIAAPSFRGFTASSNMDSNKSSMVGAFNFARMEAVKRGETVILGKQGADWSDGLVVWVDTAEDGNIANGEVLRVWQPFDSGTSVDSEESRNAFSFRATGAVNNDDNLTLCDSRTAEKGIKISVLISGAIIARGVTCA